VVLDTKRLKILPPCGRKFSAFDAAAKQEYTGTGAAGKDEALACLLSSGQRCGGF